MFAQPWDQSLQFENHHDTAFVTANTPVGAGLCPRPSSKPIILSTTPKTPVPAGLFEAIVVGPKKDKKQNTGQIHTDALGRVKIQPKWDETSGYDENSSCWIRVNQQANGGLSSQWIPRIGDEVLIGFANDNLNEPLILCSAYHYDTREPYELPQSKNISAITTHILGADHPIGHQLIFDDTPNKENFCFNVENKFQHDTLKDYIYTAKGGQETTVNGDITVHIKGKANFKAHTATFSGGGGTLKLNGGLFASPGSGGSSAGNIMLQTPTVGSAMPLARVGDHHVCPKHATPGPHKGGPIMTGSTLFKANGIPVARVNDQAHCLHDGPDRVAQGIPGVKVDGRLVARAGDKCQHGGVITAGSSNVFAGPSTPTPTHAHTLKPLYSEQPQGSHRIQGQYVDANDKGYEGLNYTIKHESGRTAKGKLDHEGKTIRMESLPEGSARFVFGDIAKQTAGVVAMAATTIPSFTGKADQAANAAEPISEEIEGAAEDVMDNLQAVPDLGPAADAAEDGAKVVAKEAPKVKKFLQFINSEFQESEMTKILSGQSWKEVAFDWHGYK